MRNEEDEEGEGRCRLSAVIDVCVLSACTKFASRKHVAMRKGLKQASTMVKLHSYSKFLLWNSLSCSGHEYFILCTIARQ